MRLANLANLLIGAALAALYVHSAIAQQATGFTSYTLMECGVFMDPSRSEIQRQVDQALVSNYARGYVTAHNLYNRRHQISRDLPNSTIVLFAQKFCRENPLLDVMVAVPSMVQELGGAPVPKR